MMFKIFSLEQDHEIHRLIEQCTPNDFHYHPNYLRLFSEYLSTEGMYAFYGDEKNYILTPIFKKRLSASKKDEVVFHLFSPWYYGGPIYHVTDQTVLLKTFRSWRKELDKYCQENNIISEMYRLNPIIDNHLLFSDDTSLSYNRDIVVIDLRKDLSQIYDEYAHKVRKNIKKAERSGLKIIHSNNKEDFEKFIEVYLLSMREKNVDSFYHFDNNFFSKLFTFFSTDLEIFRVEYQEKTIAATIVLGKYKILHDYLRGSLTQYLFLRPNDIMIHNIINFAKDKGYDYYSLGGGASTNPDDPIFNFKKSFSPVTKKFYTYKKIHNLEKYLELCLLSGKKKDELVYEQASFFPEYLKP